MFSIFKVYLRVLCYGYISSIVMNTDIFCSQVCKNVRMSGRDTENSLTGNNSKKPFSNKKNTHLHAGQIRVRTSSHLPRDELVYKVDMGHYDTV